MYGENLYGTFQYGTDTQGGDTPDEYAVDLMRYLPQYYQDSAAIKELMKIVGDELGSFAYSVADLQKQLFVDTATWGLNIWEKELGISTDRSKQYEYRRETIKAKLRGAGTTTKAMIKNVAIAFSGGEVEVLEYPSEYRFVVQFVGVKGIPPNMAGLAQSIEEIKPAHLQYEFKYTYTVWGMVPNLAWGDVSQKTWYELMIYEESD